MKYTRRQIHRMERWVAPHPGAWIEMATRLVPSTAWASLPTRGAWIEMPPRRSCSASCASLPPRGAWIEPSGKTPRLIRLRRPPPLAGEGGLFAGKGRFGAGARSRRRRPLTSCAARPPPAKGGRIPRSATAPAALRIGSSGRATKPVSSAVRTTSVRMTTSENCFSSTTTGSDFRKNSSRPSSGYGVSSRYRAVGCMTPTPHAFSAAAAPCE